MISKKYNKLTMADKGLERSAKVVTAGTPTPNPICKIFLPKFEISISDKRKRRNDLKYMFTNIKKLQKTLEYLQNNRFFGTRFRARAKAKVTSRLSVKARTQKRSKREESKLCKYESNQAVLAQLAVSKFSVAS